jgi:hypothetical protein
MPPRVNRVNGKCTARWHAKSSRTSGSLLCPCFVNTVSETLNYINIISLLLDPRLVAGDLASMVAKSPAGYL